REQVHQVPGPDLFQEGDRDALLRAKQHIPQDQRTEEESHDAWQLPLKSHQIDRNEPPYDQVQERPVKNLHQPRQTAPVQIQMPSQQRNDAVEFHLAKSSSPWEALVVVPTAAVITRCILRSNGYPAHCDRARSGREGTAPATP